MKDSIISGQSIVVTGADGFIGRALVSKLRDGGAEVVALDSHPSMDGTLEADICDAAIADLIPIGSVVIHLAALSTDGACREDPMSAVQINVIGTLNIARASREKSASQFVFASSEWIYGDKGGEALQNEETPIDVSKLESVYAITKAVVEPLLRSAIAPENVTVLRFGIVYGPRPNSWSAVERLLMDVNEKQTVQVGSLKTGRRFIYVDDLVAGIIASIGQTGHETFNLSGDVMVTMGDIISSSSVLLNRSPDVIEGNPDNWVQRNPSNERAARRLNWTPRRDIAEGLAEVAEFLGVLPPSPRETP